MEEFSVADNSFHSTGVTVKNSLDLYRSKRLSTDAPPPILSEKDATGTTLEIPPLKYPQGDLTTRGPSEQPTLSTKAQSVGKCATDYQLQKPIMPLERGLADGINDAVRDWACPKPTPLKGKEIRTLPQIIKELKGQ